ncbi:MAG: HD-GYP domain-containing protein [Deferribacterales bacterium]
MPRVLIIDDTPENLMILAEALQEDYAVSAANSAKSALKLLDKGLEFDLILSDVMMPEISGYDFLEIISRREDCKGIPVMFLTALSDNKDEYKGLSLGAVDYVTKPINIPLLKARIKNHIAHKMLRDNLEKEVRERTEQVVFSQQILIEGLGTLAEFRDPETGEHIKRTQLYVRLVADYLRTENPKYKDIISEDDVATMFRAAPLHDIGKVGISDSILLKEGPLTQEEFEKMKHHTLYGFAALRKIHLKNPDNNLVRTGMDIALNHHEKWDGSGYPQGASGEEIPLSARIMAVSDIYDALRSARPYKPAFEHDRCVSIITEGDGRTEPSHFDPDVLDAFKAIKDKFYTISVEYADKN